MPRTMQALFLVPGPEGGVYEFRKIPIPTPGPAVFLLLISLLQNGSPLGHFSRWLRPRWYTLTPPCGTQSPASDTNYNRKPQTRAPMNCLPVRAR
jgi:hypothetical protein